MGRDDTRDNRVTVHAHTNGRPTRRPARQPAPQPARRPARRKCNSFEKDRIAYRARVHRRAGILRQ